MAFGTPANGALATPPALAAPATAPGRAPACIPAVARGPGVGRGAAAVRDPGAVLATGVRGDVALGAAALGAAAMRGAGVAGFGVPARAAGVGVRGIGAAFGAAGRGAATAGGGLGAAGALAGGGGVFGAAAAFTGGAAFWANADSSTSTTRPNIPAKLSNMTRYIEDSSPRPFRTRVENVETRASLRLGRVRCYPGKRTGVAIFRTGKIFLSATIIFCVQPRTDRAAGRIVPKRPTRGRLHPKAKVPTQTGQAFSRFCLGRC